MKCINDRYVPSATDVKKAQSHCNAIARAASYDGNVEAWLDQSNGRISFIENVGSGYSVGGGNMKLLAVAYTPRRA